MKLPLYCMACGKEPWTQIEHAHNTDLIRGLVCNTCNSYIALAEHGKLVVLEYIHHYLKHPPLAKYHIPYSISKRQILLFILSGRSPITRYRTITAR